MRHTVTPLKNKRNQNRGIFALIMLCAVFLQPLSAKEVRKINSGKVEVTFYDAIDQGKIPYKYTLQNWPTQAKTAIMDAMEIMDQSLVLSKTMSVAVIWSADLASYNNIAEAYNNFVNVEGVYGASHLDSNYKYPRELLNQLVVNNLYSGNNITIAFNSTKDWCYSKNEEPNSNQQDLITVALHELSHGLGISSSFNKNNESTPYIYDKYIVDGNGWKLVANGSFTRSNQEILTSNNLFYAGPNLLQENKGKPLKLHAPGNLSSASLCHFDRNYGSDEDGRLLIPGTAYGVSTRFFGNYILAILEDMGWVVKSSMKSNTVNNENIYLAEIKVSSTSGEINIENPNFENLKVTVYSITGKLIKNTSINGSEKIPVNSNEIYIVKINNKTFKIRA